LDLFLRLSLEAEGLNLEKVGRDAETEKKSASVFWCKGVGTSHCDIKRKSRGGRKTTIYSEGTSCKACPNIDRGGRKSLLTGYRRQEERGALSESKSTNGTSHNKRDKRR